MGGTNKSEAIAEKLAAEIRNGRLTGKLPSEKELAKTYATAGMTAARALNILREKKLVERVSGRGTFVIQHTVRKLRFFWRGYFADNHLDLLVRLVPNVELVPAASLAEADLAVFATTMPMNYSSNFLPWPANVVEKLKASGRFYPQVFEFHHIGTPTYAVAYNFSPNVFMYNRKRMREVLSGFDPYDFTFRDLVNLSRKCPGTFMEKPDAGNVILFALSYAAGSLRKAIPAYREIAFTPPQSGKSFQDGDFLLAPMLRETPGRLGDFSRFDVMPMPEINGKRCCHAASEAVFVPISSRYPELAFELAEASLSPDFQREVAAMHANIPADTAIAAASMDSRRFRDDIFFNEIPNIHFPREIIDPVSAAIVLAAFKRFASSAISPDEFLRLLGEEENFVRRRRQALEFVLQPENKVESF